MERAYRELDIGKVVLRIYADGEVWAHPKPYLVKLHADKDGYLYVHVRGFRQKLHRLLLTLFVRPPLPGEQGRHLDDNKSNCALGNLAWGTGAQNWADSKRNGTAQIGEKHGKAKLTEEQVKEIRATPRKYGSQRELAARYGVSRDLIGKIVRGEQWRHLTDSPPLTRQISPIGSTNPNATLTEQDVRVIRSARGPRGFLAALARRYSVSATTITDIRKGKTWGHVTSDNPDT